MKCKLNQSILSKIISSRRKRELRERIVGEYNTIFGKAIVLIPDKQYSIDDHICLSDGNYRITQVIPPTRPTKDGRISLVVERLNGLHEGE